MRKECTIIALFLLSVYYHNGLLRGLYITSASAVWSRGPGPLLGPKWSLALDDSRCSGSRTRAVSRDRQPALRPAGEITNSQRMPIKKGGDAICNVHRRQAHTHSRASGPERDDGGQRWKSERERLCRRSTAADPRRRAARRSGRSSCSRRATGRPFASAGPSDPEAVANKRTTG